MDNRYETTKQEVNEIKELMLLNGGVGSALTVLLVLHCWDSIQTETVGQLAVLILLSIGLACLSAFSLKQGMVYRQILHALKKEDYETVDRWVKTQAEKRGDRRK